MKASIADASAVPLDDADSEREIDRLSKLKGLTYQRQRDAAATSIGIPPGSLDRLVKARQRDIEDTTDGSGQGRVIELPEPKPWDKPVDGATLLSEIAAETKRYMIMPSGAPETVALWVLHCHALEAFGISPRLAITSPQPGCGKTTLLDILHQLVPRPLLMANISAAAVFRTVEVVRPVLLADEADTWLQGNDELRGILNSGHRRGGNVVRVVGDDHEPRQFSTWGACAVALIGKLASTLADRSITIALYRKRHDETVEQFRYDRTETLDLLARKAARWGADNAKRLSTMDPAMPVGLYNRVADNWRPLLAVADAAGGNWSKRARDIAAATVDAEQSKRAGLLADIRDIFAVRNAEKISSAALADALAAIEGRDWAEYSNSKPISKNQLAKLLSGYAISPATIRVGAGDRDTVKGYKRAQFADAFARYLSDQNVTPSQRAESRTFSSKIDPSQLNGRDVLESVVKPQFSPGCDV